MALYLEHNFDTSLNMFVKILNDAFLEQFSWRGWANNANIKNGKFIKIVDSTLEKDLLSLIEKLKTEDNGDYLPTILIAQSKEIDQSKYLSQLSFMQKENIELVSINNPDSKMWLEGVVFDFETKIQFVILTRDNMINKELALELLKNLAQNKSVKYPLKIMNSEAPNDFHYVEDFGRIDIMGFENSTPVTEEIGDDDMLVVATTMEATLREQYIRLKDADVYKRAVIEPTINNYVAGSTHLP